MKNLKQDIETGNFQHVYLLYGEETYLKLQFRDRLLNALMPEGGGMNLNSFSGDKVDENDVIESGNTLPFFSERRVIRLDDTGFFTRSTEHLPDYLKSLPDYLYLVFTEKETDGRNRLFKAVKSVGRCVDFRKQDERTLSRWVLQMLTAEGLKIRAADMDYLLSLTGTDMSHVKMEVDKLLHFCGGKEEVTRSDIDAVISVTAEGRVFDMISAIAGRRQAEAMNLYADLLALKEPPLRILLLISRQYQRLLMIRELMGEGLSNDQIAERTGIHPYGVKRERSVAEMYSPSYLQHAIGECAKADEAVKTGSLTDRLAIELLIIQLSNREDAAS